MPLWKSLAFNKSLQCLNLSWNMLLDKACYKNGDDLAELQAKYSQSLNTIIEKGQTNKFINREFMSGIQP